MSDQTQTTTDRATPATKKKWALVITGSAVLLLAAGVMMQVMRPTAAYPEDGSPGAARATASSRPGSGEQDSKRIRKVAVVGKEFISYDELAAECVQRFGKDVLDNLINRKIIQQACDNQQIEISDAEVSREIERNAKKFGLAVDQWLAMLENDRNVTPLQYRRDIIWPMLALRKLAGEEVKISKADIDRAFIRNYGERVLAKAIILDNQRRATEAWDKAQANPDEFEELVKQYSIDPATKAMGGKIPDIQRYGGGSKEGELEVAAFKLKKGRISPVVQVGLHQWIILKCEGRTKPTVTEMTHDIEQILVEQLKEEKTAEAVARVFEKIKSEARVTNYVTNESTGGERRQQTAKTAGNAGPIKQTSGTGKRMGNGQTAGSAATSGRSPNSRKAPPPTDDNE